MRRLLLTTVLLTIFTAAPASAEYYLTKQQAQSNARDYARDKHGLRHVGTSCRPKGTPNPDTQRYAYHRWMCAYAGYSPYYDDTCGGYIQIKGGDRTGVYWYIVYVGLRCG